MKKFYKKDEVVWVKPLKQTGIVLDVNPENKDITVICRDKDGVDFKTIYKLWQVDKYRKPLEIKIKYFDETLPKIEAIKIGNWIDLRASEDISMKQFDFKLIPLGIAMKLPRGFEANIVPRSSTFKNFGILQTNHYGVIDESYSGNDDQWMFPALAMRDTEIKKGSRICQFRVNRIMGKVKFLEVNQLDEVSRGGFGTTGTN